jgi:hypothetical protein
MNFNKKKYLKGRGTKITNRFFCSFVDKCDKSFITKNTKGKDKPYVKVCYFDDNCSFKTKNRQIVNVGRI